MRVSDELKAMAESTPGRDGYFAAMYYQVTRSIEDDLDDFNNPEGMEEFVRIFSARYIDAYFGAVHSKCWRAAFQAEDDDRLLIVQHLLLGINAHVNYDLPQAVNDFARQEGLEYLTYGDYRYVNIKLRQAYATILDNLDLASRWANEVAGLGGGTLFHFSLVKAREVAWNSAELLRKTDKPDEYLEVLDDWVSGLSYLITLPDGCIHRILGLFEDKNPITVTDKLLK